MLIIIREELSRGEKETLINYLRSAQVDYSVWNDGEFIYYGLSKSLQVDLQEKISQLPFVVNVLAESGSDMPVQPVQSVKIKKRKIGRDNFTIIAGPCTIDNLSDLDKTAKSLKSLGVNFLRGGAYKLRSSPFSYQGLGKEALIYLKETCRKYDMISVSEIISIDDLKLMCDNVDILIVGTRNMQNFRLLTAIGESRHPVILKRGMANTIKEWILAADYIRKEGNEAIILCERGIRTFENYTRNTLDISAIPVVRKLTPYPVLVDPSHSSGAKELVKPLSWAAAAAGADGLLIECHLTPEKALCDAQQTIGVIELKEIVESIPQITRLWNRSDNDS